MKNYSLGFSFRGLIFYGAQLLPNIAWRLFPPANDVLAQNTSPYLWLDITEWTLGILTILILVFVVNRQGGSLGVGPLIVCTVLMFVYYISWGFYLFGVIHPWFLMLGMVLVPPVYFLCAGLWLRNRVIILPALLFLVSHVSVYLTNFPIFG